MDGRDRRYASTGGYAPGTRQASRYQRTPVQQAIDGAVQNYPQMSNRLPEETLRLIAQGFNAQPQPQEEQKQRNRPAFVQNNQALMSGLDMSGTQKDPRIPGSSSPERPQRPIDMSGWVNYGQQQGRGGSVVDAARDAYTMARRRR